MAIWQVPVNLSSRKVITKRTEEIMLNSLKRLAEVFPKEKSWCNSIMQYGALDSTCLEIDTESRRFDADLRIDVRTITMDQLRIIANFANENDLKVKYKKKVYEPTVDVFVNIIRESDANRFATKPEEFLDGIAKKKKHIE